MLLTGAVWQDAHAQDVVAQRFWSPSPVSSSFPAEWVPGRQSVALADGWSASATGYRIHGHSLTDNVVADGDFASHGYVVGLAKSITPNWTVGVRVEDGDNHVNYHQLQGRVADQTTHGIALDVILEDEHVVWRNTASVARDRYQAFFDPFTPGAWDGTEWAFDTQANLRQSFGRATGSVFVGFRRLTLTQHAFVSTDAFGGTTDFLAQQRMSTQVRAGVDLQGTIFAIRSNLVLLGHVGGTVEAEANPHAPIALAADLTGMAGNSFSFDFPDAEPPRFPASVSYVANAGLELRAAGIVHLFFNATAGQNPLLHWQAYEAGARVVF